jgi:hypothetical protein
MGLLLYKSDEMYSSTELIRKSKMIFEKIIDEEIDKAIILRDGKPCFLLMDFQKYERIMSEYEALKKRVESLKDIKVEQEPAKVKKAKPKKEEYIPTEEKKEEPVERQVTIPIQKIAPKDTSEIEEIANNSNKENDVSEEKEISDAMQSIESMNFDDDMKKVAQEKIKVRIIQAREERARVLEDENQHKEDLKEELILQGQLKETKKKKDRELREFWD